MSVACTIDDPVVIACFMAENVYGYSYFEERFHEAQEI